MISRSKLLCEGTRCQADFAGARSAFLNWLVLGRDASVIGALGGLLGSGVTRISAFAFTDPAQRFKFLVRWKITDKYVVPDRKRVWRWIQEKLGVKIYLLVYWFTFIVLHLVLTLGVFILVYVLAVIQWRYNKWRWSDPGEPEVAVGLEEGLWIAGWFMGVVALGLTLTHAFAASSGGNQPAPTPIP